MILDENLQRTHRERIERHKRIVEGRAYNVKDENEVQNNPFVFQSIICMFIFATLVIVKLTNTTFTDKIVLSINTTLEQDNMPEIVNFAKNINEKSNFGTLDNLEDNEIILDDTTNSESVETDSIPATEFTIDENMLSDIDDDSTKSDLLEKK